MSRRYKEYEGARADRTKVAMNDGTTYVDAARFFGSFRADTASAPRDLRLLWRKLGETDLLAHEGAECSHEQVEGLKRSISAIQCEISASLQQVRDWRNQGQSA